MKNIKGEKYIYLAMAYTLAKKNSLAGVQVGYDNNFTSGFMYWRRFTVTKYGDKELLQETKSSRHCANFTRVFEVLHYSKDRPDFRDYINEAGENGAKHWVH